MSAFEKFLINNVFYPNDMQLTNNVKLSFPDNLKKQYLSTKANITQDLSSLLNLEIEQKNGEIFGQSHEFQFLLKS